MKWLKLTNAKHKTPVLLNIATARIAGPAAAAGPNAGGTYIIYGPGPDDAEIVSESPETVEAMLRSAVGVVSAAEMKRAAIHGLRADRCITVNDALKMLRECEEVALDEQG